MAAPDPAADAGDATVDDVGHTIPGFRPASDLYDTSTGTRTLDAWTPPSTERGRDE